MMAVADLTHQREDIALVHDLVNEEHTLQAEAARDMYGLQRFSTPHGVHDGQEHGTGSEDFLDAIHEYRSTFLLVRCPLIQTITHQL
jgi:hypothetical protein